MRTFSLFAERQEQQMPSKISDENLTGVLRMMDYSDAEYERLLEAQEWPLSEAEKMSGTVQDGHRKGQRDQGTKAFNCYICFVIKLLECKIVHIPVVCSLFCDTIEHDANPTYALIKS